MKKNRRITAILTAACLTMPLACTAVVPFSAVAAGTNSITVSGTTNSDIAAYQVFAGSYANNVLGVTGWGSGINSSGFLTALKGSSAFGSPNPFAEASTAVKVAEIISGFTNNSDKANEVARLALQNVSTTSSGSVTGNVISGLDDGYYVVKDKTTATTGETAWTLGLLQVAGGNVEVIPKTSYPTVEKQVKENNGGWDSVADYNCGDEVPFRITATLPSNIDLYESYFLQFNDELNSNFKMPAQDSDITLKIGANAENAVPVKGDTSKWNVGRTPSSNTIIVQITDLKGLKDTSGNAISITTDKKVFVEYNAVLKGGAALDLDGSDNKVQLVYSNDPNVSAISGITGNTPESAVKVYTYNLDIHKVDGDDNDTGLKGAKFKIKNSEGKWAKKNTSTEEGAAPILWVTSDSDATEFETDDEGDITSEIMGIDAGVYTIVETKAPDGYNIAKDITLTIIPTYSSTELTELKYQIGDEDPIAVDGNTVTVEIKNNKGKTLPTTGGIGTKIFYIVGGMLVIGSGAALVIKKRIGKDEE